LFLLKFRGLFSFAKVRGFREIAISRVCVNLVKVHGVFCKIYIHKVWGLFCKISICGLRVDFT